MIIYKFKSKTRSLLDRLASRLSFKVILLVSCLLIFGTKSLPRPKSLSPSFFETMACPGEAVPAHLGRFSRRPLGTWWAIWGIAVRSNHAAGSWNNTILGNHLENTVTLLFIPLQYWLFTPESQWQSRGKWCILQGYNGKRWA